MKRMLTEQKVLGNALVWAAMIIASSLLIEDGKTASTMLFLLLGGWFASSNFIGSSAKTASTECAALKRLFSFKSS